MIKVPNKPIINVLSFRLIKTNKARNFFAIAAIVLTSILVMVVLTMGVGLMDASRLTLMKSSGQKAEISFQYLMENEVECIISHPLIKEYGISKYIAATNEGVWNQTTLEIRTADKNFADMLYSTPTIGRLPESENEVAVKSWMLDKLGIKNEIGQVFPLSFTVGDTRYNLELTVSGIWDNDYYLLPYGTAFISDMLADKLIAKIDVKHNRENGNYSGVIQLYANMNGSLSDLDKNLNKLVSETGIDKTLTLPRVNFAYSNSEFDIQSWVAIALILLIVIMSGYLLIYNIFYISVIRDIKYYGLLKAIGTTKQQIKRIVNIQAFIYCLIGIPLGLVLGYFLAAGMFPLFISTTSIDNDINIKLNLFAINIAAFLSLITVFISCNYPAKIARKISPVEATRYAGISNKKNKNIKYGYSGASVNRMAFANLFKNKKRTIVTIASVSIGLILLNIIFTFTDSFNVNEMVKTYIYGDFMIADSSYLNMASSYNPAYTLSDEIINEISSLDGVTDVARVYYKYYEGTYIDDTTNMHAQLYGMDDYWLDILEKNVIEGVFDRDKFLSGNYILIGSDMQNLLDIGDIVTLDLNDNTQYEVMAKVDYSNLTALSARFILGVGFSAYLPKSELANCDNVDIMSATVIAKNGKLGMLKEKIDTILKNNSNLDFRSRSDYIIEMNNNNSQFTFVGITLSLVILLIGILNFINTTSTNIISRKYEFAMLQAIGMTTKQNRNMLMLEGLYFIIISGIIFITIGYTVSFLIVRMLMENSPAFTYRFSILPLLISLPILFLMAIILPLCLYKIISKNTIVERIHEIA